MFLQSCPLANCLTINSTLDVSQEIRELDICHVKLLSHVWLCNPMDCSPPGSSIHGIFQERLLEWVTISFFRGFSPPRDWTQVSCIAGRCFTVWATREARRLLALFNGPEFPGLELKEIVGYTASQGLRPTQLLCFHSASQQPSCFPSLSLNIYIYNVYTHYF